MSSFPPEFDAIAEAFRWRSMDGRVLYLREMKTSHIFNSMKMVFNHIAEEYGGRPVWYVHPYAGVKDEVRRRPREQARLVALFCYEIEARGDLPERYEDPYNEIMSQILNLRELRMDAIGSQQKVLGSNTSAMVCTNDWDRYFEAHYHEENDLCDVWYDC
jgi:hypothetical protein